MANTPYPQDWSVYLEWVNAIIAEASDDLSDWENSFIESVEKQLLTRRWISENQAITLEKIYAEKTN